jgi:Protein of unknown function (DUF3303)
LSASFFKEVTVKYVLAWTVRSGGSAAENEEGAKRALQMYQKWAPPSGLEILQWVARVDGEGGYAVVETDDPAILAGISARFSPYLVGQTHPVVNMDEWAGLVGEGIKFRESVG